MRTAKKTVPTLDLFRLAAVLLVVMNHTSPLADMSAMADFWLTRVLARVAVPFFLMTTGYFLSRNHWAGVGRQLKKLCLLYGVCGRFRRLAARYGFIERYQRGKEEVTGISAEPWHFRYVGAPHAQLMETNGLCLEEYRDFLRQGPRSVALENGRMAQVFYVPAAGAVTEVEVPEGCCQISGDNVEGFILTWWGDTHENG